jgi:hypothetical protein
VRTRWRVLVGVGIAIGIVLVLLEGVWLWRSTGGAPRTGKAKRPAAVLTPQGGADPVTGAPRWLGQTGVKGRPIAGVVVGEDGAPVAGATVRVASSFSIAGLVTVPTRKTDAQGRFDFGPQPAASYVVSAELPTLTAAIVQTDLRDVLASPPSDQLRLVMHPCHASIHGTVFDTAEGAIGGATLVRVEHGLATGAGAIADDSGTFELCVPAGGAEVTVSADGYAAIEETINVFGRTRRDFRLVPGTSVSGRAIRAGDKAPVAGAIIELRSADPRDNEAPLSTASAEDGTFHFDSVAAGRHGINALAERLATAVPVDVTTSIGEATTDVVCELAATYQVSGHVIDKISKKPVSGRAVFLATDDWSPLNPRYSSATTQADGSFTLDHVRSGEYGIYAENGRRRGTTSVKVETADVTDLAIEVDAGATISGRVLAGGTPLDGVAVRIGRWNATSAADGRYVLHGVEPGTYEVYAESHRVGAFTRDQYVTVVAGEDQTGVDVELDLAGSISGVVFDQNGAPVPGVFLSFSLVHGTDFGSATTADDGTFTARALSGGGDYVYEVRQRDQASLALPPASGKRHPPVTVKDGQTHVTGVRVQIRYERLVITGRVTDSAGKPVADAKVEAVPSGGEWFRVPSTTSTESGGFSIADLPADSYTLTATTLHGEGSVANVAAGTKNVAIRLLAAGGIDGTLTGFTKTPEVVAFRHDRFERRRPTVTGTSFQLRDLSPGRYTITATAGDQRAQANVEVTSGAVATATLKVHGVGVVVGTVLDAKTRAPLADLKCVAVSQNADDMDVRREQVRSDAGGAFRLERAPEGEVFVSCYSGRVMARTQATVTAGQVTTVELAATRMGSGARIGRYSGLELENQLADVLVTSVAPASPAAEAGIVVGDVVVKVEDETIGRDAAEMASRMIEYGEANPMKLVLERNDKQITASIAF